MNSVVPARQPAVADTCPSPEHWRGLLGEAAPGGEEQQFFQHLEQCADCQRVVERLSGESAGSSSLVELLRQPTPKLESALVDLQVRMAALGDVVEPRFSTEMPAEPIGKLDDYLLLAPLGRGGMGQVYLAWDPKLQRKVAVKMLRAELAALPRERDRFLMEARALAALRHDYVVTLHAVAESGDEARKPYLVMEHLAGGSLQQQVDQRGRLPIRDLLTFGEQAARGLNAAHDKNILHRDLKPANLLLDEQTGRLKLSDFGLAQPSVDSATGPGLIAGTPTYMAPEQTRGERHTVAADLYGLGAVLYCLATGQPPFAEDDRTRLFQRIQQDEPRSVRELNPAVPPAVAALIHELLAKDAHHRPASAKEVAERLHAASQALAQPVPVELASAATATKPLNQRLAVGLATFLIVGVYIAYLAFQAASMGQGGNGYDSPDPAKLFPTILGKQHPPEPVGVTVDPAKLRYRWQGRAEFPYEIKMEVEQSEQRFTVRGNLIYRPQPDRTEDTLELRVAGNLFGQIEPKQREPGQFPVAPVHFGGPIILTTAMGYPLLRQTVFGSVQRCDADEPIPYGLGNARCLMIEPLPLARQNQWQTERDVKLAWGVPARNRGMYGLPPNHLRPRGFGMPEEPSVGPFPAKAKESYTLLKADAKEATIKKQFTVSSLEGDRGRPKAVVTGSSELVFDLEAGAPRRLRWTGEATLRDQGTSRSYPVTLTANLLSEADWQARMKQAEEQQKKHEEEQRKKKAPAASAPEATQPQEAKE